MDWMKGNAVTQALDQNICNVWRVGLPRGLGALVLSLRVCSEIIDSHNNVFIILLEVLHGESTLTQMSQ